MENLDTVYEAGEGGTYTITVTKEQAELLDKSAGGDLANLVKLVEAGKGAGEYEKQINDLKQYKKAVDDWKQALAAARTDESYAQELAKQLGDATNRKWVLDDGASKDAGKDGGKAPKASGDNNLDQTLKAINEKISGVERALAEHRETTSLVTAYDKKLDEMEKNKTKYPHFDRAVVTKTAREKGTDDFEFVYAALIGQKQLGAKEGDPEENTGKKKSVFTVSPPPSGGKGVNGATATPAKPKPRSIRSTQARASDISKNLGLTFLQE